MPKIFAAALLTASAIGSLLLVPAAPAHAQSDACNRAIVAINKAIDGSPDGVIDDVVAQALHFTLMSLDAQGEEKAAITGYANALLDENVSDLDPYTTELNRVCGA